jgi:hypothetical protein
LQNEEFEQAKRGVERQNMIQAKWPKTLKLD